MTGTLRRLPDAPDARPAPVAPGIEDHAMRRATVEAVEHPEAWTGQQAEQIGSFFDALVPDWDEHHGGPLLRPLDDALVRGGTFDGVCIEVGSGTGLATPTLAAVFDGVVSVDVSAAMLVGAAGRSPMRVRADGAVLPVPTGSAGAVVIVNSLLFPAEVDRVLAPDGALVWVCTRGPQTPIYLPSDEVVERMPGRWDGVESAAGEGIWAVLRRSGATG
jgi:SAM-dependent methyltransferase